MTDAPDPRPRRGMSQIVHDMQAARLMAAGSQAGEWWHRFTPDDMPAIEMLIALVSHLKASADMQASFKRYLKGGET